MFLFWSLEVSDRVTCMFMVKALFLGYVLHNLFMVHGERGKEGREIFQSLYKGTNPIVGNPPSWLNLNLITFKGPAYKYHLFLSDSFCVNSGL